MKNSPARFKGGFYRPFRFEIVVGELTVDMVQGSNNIYIQNWRPAAPAYKGGGTFQESALTDGRQLVDTRFENVEEIISFSIDANDVDSAIYASRQLRIAFEECAGYWTNDWNETIGYLVVQETRESNVRYATIVKGRMPEDEFPFGQLVWQDNGRCLWDGLVCSIEHLPWQPTIPGTGEAVSIGVKSTFSLVPNGSFEDWSGGNPVNWTDDGTPTTTENTNINFIQSGTSSLFMETSGTEGVRQDIGDMWPGTVTVTAWVYLLSGTATLRMNINGTSTLIDSDSTSVTGEWIQLSATGVITNVGVRILLQIASGSGYWDDVELPLYFGNVDLGATGFPVERSTAADEVFIVNKHNVAQLTHVYLYDGSWSTNLVQVSNNALTGNAVGHAIYFGIETGGARFSNPTPFNNLVFDIDTPLSSTGSVTVVWHYWNGSSWTALSSGVLHDNTNTFKVSGVGSMHFLPPADWTAGDLNTIAGTGTPPSVTALWIRARISAASGTVTPATNQNRSIYTIVWPYVEVLNDQLGGDIRPLLQLIHYNRSDDTDDLFFARSDTTIIGARSTSRGEDFTAFINLADEQHPFGITVSGGVGSFGDNLQAPTGRYVTFTPASANDSVFTLQQINISYLIASQYFGRYHAFVRVDDVSGSGFPISLRLRVNGVTRYQTPYTPTATSGGEAVDVGEFVIDPGTVLPSEIPDLAIDVLSKQVATTQLAGFDVVLIPVDEWAVSVDIDGRQASRQIFIDSITYPKRICRVKSVDIVTTNTLVDSKNPLVNGPASLKRSGKQRLWFLFTNNQNIEINFVTANTVQLNLAKRYLSARGNN